MSVTFTLNDDEYLSKEDFLSEFSDLPELTKETLWRIKQRGIISFEQKGDKGEFTVELTPAFSLILTVENLQVSKTLGSREVYSQTERISCNNGDYHIRFKYENPESDELKNIDFYFTNPREKIEVLNCCYILGEPWHELSTVADEIVYKSELSLNLCNQKEVELLPLLKELQSFGGTAEELFGFTLLKELASKYGYTEIVKALRKIEGMEIDSFKSAFKVQQQFDVFSKSEYEPMWRELFAEISDSQKDYPRNIEKIEGNKKLKKLRKDVEARFLLEGYKGSYPDFYKQGAMKGIHLVNSYEMSYWVGMKQNAGYFIHCVEFFDGENISIAFISGTDLTKGKKCEDIYSCMFSDNGKRLFQLTVFSEESDDLTTALSIALKRAECKPLNKHEKGSEYNGKSSAVLTFLFYLIVCGGLFSVAFNLLLIPMMWGMDLLFGATESFGEFFAWFPWKYTLAFAWVGFGGALGLVQALSKRK